MNNLSYMMLKEIMRRIKAIFFDLQYQTNDEMLFKATAELKIYKSYTLIYFIMFNCYDTHLSSIRISGFNDVTIRLCVTRNNAIGMKSAIHSWVQWPPVTSRGRKTSRCLGHM